MREKENENMMRRKEDTKILIQYMKRLCISIQKWFLQFSYPATSTARHSILKSQYIHPTPQALKYSSIERWSFNLKITLRNAF